jgi:hypothetical protein
MAQNDQTASLSRSSEPLMPQWYGDEVSDVVLLDRFVEQWDQDGKKDGKTDLAIYAWDGANLKLCWVRDGDKHPSEFATKPGDKCVLVILKRQDP